MSPLVRSDTYNLVLLVARVWVAIVMFAHGWRHVKALRAGPGMANWFESLGLRPGAVHAQMVTLTELVIPVGLVAGLLTPAAYGGTAAVMFVALMTNHLRNGFFLSSAREGYEYVATVGVLSIVLGALGPGRWSLDRALDLGFPFDPKQALAVAAGLGIVGTALFLAAFWRPPRRDGAGS
jgi:putative oxidoreductase